MEEKGKMEAENNHNNRSYTGATRYVEPNKKEFKNVFYILQEEMAEGYVTMLREGMVFDKYNDIIKQLTQPETTLEDRARIEQENIKKDLEYLSQCYFGNVINYGEYIAAIHNILNAFTIIRHNWNLQHPNKIEDVVTEAVMEEKLKNN